MLYLSTKLLADILIHIFSKETRPIVLHLISKIPKPSWLRRFYISCRNKRQMRNGDNNVACKRLDLLVLGLHNANKPVTVIIAFMRAQFATTAGEMRRKKNVG